MHPSHQSKVAKLNRLATLLDSQFRIPFTQFRIGLDGLIGLMPVYGDIVSFLLSLTIIIMIARMGVPASVLLRVCANSLMDFLVGLVPILGDFADVFLKSNLKNVKLAQKYFDQPQKINRQSWVLVTAISGSIFLIFIAMVGALMWAIFQLLNYLQALYMGH